MPVGFQCFTDNGTVQIDENFVCSSFRLGGTITATLGWDYPPNRYYDIVVTSATFPMIALTSASAYVTIAGISVSGTTWTFRVLVVGGDYTFQYYVYDKPVAPTGPGFGFQVFKPDGDLVWDSNQSVMPYVGVIAAGNNYVGASGRKYAFIHTSHIEAYYDTNIDTLGSYYTYWSFSIGAHRRTSNGIEYTNTVFSSGGNTGTQGPDPFYPGLGGNGFTNPFVLILDVTDL